MRNTSLTLSTVLFSLLLAAGCRETDAGAPVEEADTHGAVKGNTAFAVDLISNSAARGKYLLSTAQHFAGAGETDGGARGNTAEEMAAALHFPENHEQLHRAFERLNRKLAQTAESTGQKLNIANGLCLTGGDVSPEYKNLLANSYDAEFFRGGVDKINAWVSTKTEGKIERILDQLTANSFVLLNAIYFKGSGEPVQGRTDDDHRFCEAEEK